jgi:hypothetical protein
MDSIVIVFISEIVPHVGQFCEVTTSGGRVFGELVRLSTALFLVRPKWPITAGSRPIAAAEIKAIAELPDPHL